MFRLSLLPLRATLTALGVVLVVVGALGLWNPGRLVLLEQHPAVAGWVGVAGMGVVALAQAVPSRAGPGRLTASVALATVACCGAGLLLVAGPLGPRVVGEQVVARSAHGDLRIVHIRTRNVIDPVDRLVLRSGRGLLSRQDEIGCFNPDASSRSFAHARFLDGGRLQIVADGPPQNRWALAFAPDSAEMRQMLPDDVC